MSADDLSTNASLVILGARGSIPVSGPEFGEYGGSTTCIAIVDGATIDGFFDAGTGLMAFRGMGLDLARSVQILLTHYHWDHIQGLSMLGEVWSGACSFAVRGAGDPAGVLNGAIRPPWFPVSLAEAPEPLEFMTVDDEMSVGGAAVEAFDVNHPQGALGYLIRGSRRSAALVTDHESSQDHDDRIAAAIDGVDVLIHDAQYLPAEADAHRGWGHSTWEDAVRMAVRADASELVLTSHDPSRSDSEIDAMVAEAGREFPNVSAARPGMKIQI